jgi:hypothetical protein
MYTTFSDKKAMGKNPFPWRVGSKICSRVVLLTLTIILQPRTIDTDLASIMVVWNKTHQIA